MANRQRINCIPGDHCHDLPPPSPPPPPPPQLPTPIDRSFSPYLIFMFCGLAVSFCFICYLIFATRYRRYQRNRDNTDETDEDLANDYLGPVIHHPVWLIDTIGLEKSQIESIQVFKYKKDQGLIEGTDCSVCLSEFEDDESLRLLPKCSHAFHVPCIDTWLTSHKNCPMCRAPIFNATSAQTETIIEVNTIEPSTREETPSDQDSQTVDHHVVDVENNGEVEKTRPILNKTCSGTRAQSDLADHHRVEGDASVATRRSVSMNESLASVVHFAVANIPNPDQERTLTSQIVVSKRPNNIPKSGHKLKGSSSSFHIHSKAMKSSSFGRSLQKASSFTNKCPPHNRSY